MFQFLRRKQRTGGLLAYLGLTGWWESELTAEERTAVMARYQPMGSESTSLTSGEVAYSSQTPLHFLWGLATWLKGPQDLLLAQKIFAKGSRLLAESPVLDVHFFHQGRIEFFYRLRDAHPEARAIAEQACRDQIAIAPQAAKAFIAQHDDGLPSHKGFWQLAVILEKDGRLLEAVEVCKSAQAAGWPGDWEARREKLLKKLTKPPIKNDGRETRITRFHVSISQVARMSESIEPGTSQSFTFEREKPGTVQVNHPMRYVIRTSSGSLIEGVITPNNPLTITSQGDVTTVNLYVEEQTLQPLRPAEA